MDRTGTKVGTFCCKITGIGVSMLSLYIQLYTMRGFHRYSVDTIDDSAWFFFWCHDGSFTTTYKCWCITFL